MYNQGMKPASSPPLWPTLLLPLLLGLAFNLAPRSAVVSTTLPMARWAEDHENPAAAANHLEGAAGALPWRSDLFERAGLDALAARDSQSAIRLLEAAQARAPLSADGMIGIGEAYYLSGNTREAIRLWGSLAQLPNPPAQVYSKLSDAHLQSGDLKAAIADLRDQLAISPDQPQVLFRLGLMLAIDQPEEALPMLFSAAHLDPSLDASVRTMQAAFNKVPSGAEPAYRLLLTGRGLASIHTWDLAAVSFGQAIQISPDYADAWAFLGEARQQLGLDGSAELTRARQLGPDSALVQALSAVSWQRQGKIEEAVQSLEAAAAAEPENPVWQHELGNAWAAQGDLGKALEYYQRAIELSPQDADYWRALAEFSIENGYALQDVGFPAARQAVILAPKDPANLDVMSQAFLKAGDYYSAERFSRQALEADPDDAMAHLHLGISLLNQGKMDDAQPCFLRAVTLASGEWAGEQAQRFLDRYY